MFYDDGCMNQTRKELNVSVCEREKEREREEKVNWRVFFLFVCVCVCKKIVSARLSQSIRMQHRYIFVSLKGLQRCSCLFTIKVR